MSRKPKLKNRARIALVAAGLLSVFAVHAGETEDAIAKRLMASVPGLKVSAVRPSPAAGIYEVEGLKGDIIYTTADGQFLLTGDLLELSDQGISNVTENARSQRRADVMSKFGGEGVIRFPAKNEKARIAVFTDIDCPYCRKLHDDVPRLNELGITVDYYGYPRSGPGTPSFNKYISVWCAEDPQKALTDAKQGRQVAESSCNNPVRKQFELGNQVGVTGTPAIVLDDGTMVRGYLPANKLAEGLGLL